jgi:hypothetical protein
MRIMLFEILFRRNGSSHVAAVRFVRAVNVHAAVAKARARYGRVDLAGAVRVSVRAAKRHGGRNG